MKDFILKNTEIPGRKSFVRYIDRESGRYVNEDVGKCDHENSCGYHLRPKDFSNGNNRVFKH